MDTAYKTRAWWANKALALFRGVAADDQHRDDLNRRLEHPEQVRAWMRRGEQAMMAALAPSGSECLTRVYVDRSGTLLPEHVV